MDYTQSHSHEDTSPEDEDHIVSDLSTPDSPDQSHQAVEQCTSTQIGECQDLFQAVTVSFCF